MITNYTGKYVTVKDKNSIYYGEWGRIIGVTEDNEFYVAIADGTDSIPLFDRSQIKIRKDK